MDTLSSRPYFDRKLFAGGGTSQIYIRKKKVLETHGERVHNIFAKRNYIDKRAMNKRTMYSGMDCCHVANFLSFSTIFCLSNVFQLL